MGDIIVGDADGVVVVPAHLVAEISAETVEQERMEGWILDRVRAGARLPGTYPPDAATRAEYEAWRASQGG
jgi:regulator of RNase E activity RraA